MLPTDPTTKALLLVKFRLPNLEALDPADIIETLFVVLSKLKFPLPVSKRLVDMILPTKEPLIPSITFPDELIVTVLVPLEVIGAFNVIFEELNKTSDPLLFEVILLLTVNSPL